MNDVQVFWSGLQIVPNIAFSADCQGLWIFAQKIGVQGHMAFSYGFGPNRQELPGPLLKTRQRSLLSRMQLMASAWPCLWFMTAGARSNVDRGRKRIVGFPVRSL